MNPKAASIISSGVNTYGVPSTGTKKYHPIKKFHMGVYPAVGKPFGVWPSPSDIIIGKEGVATKGGGVVVNVEQASGGAISIPRNFLKEIPTVKANAAFSDIGDTTQVNSEASKLFGTVLGVSGGIYGLFYASKQKSGVIGFIGYFLLFSLIGTTGGSIIDSVVPSLKKIK
jgi:hypothetical protein